MKPARSLEEYEAAMKATAAPPPNCGQAVRNSDAEPEKAAPPVVVHVQSVNPFAVFTAPIPGRRPGKLSAVGWLGVVSGVLALPLCLVTPVAAVVVGLGVACWFWARRG